MAEITFSDLSVEARTEVILEAAEESVWAIESTDKKIARLAELLKQQKAALGHGNWLPWVKATFGDSDAAIWKVQRWMRGRSNNAPAHYLELDDADDPQEKSVLVVTPRAERKTGRVEVQEAGQTVVQADPPPGMAMVSSGGDYQPYRQKDNDPNPAPKTNTYHTPATAKAKESDRETPPIITPVIIEDPPAIPEPPTLADWPVSEIIGFLKASADEPKKRAKELRKAADELDPPKKLRTPDLDECLEFFQLLNSDQGEQFFDFYQSKGWLVGKVPMKDWQAAGRRWIRENEKGTFSNGNGQPRLTTTQQREQNTATAFDRFRQAAADAARIGDRGDVPRRIGAAGVIETDAGAD